MKNGCNVLGANFSSGFLLTGKNNERTNEDEQQQQLCLQCSSEEIHPHFWWIARRHPPCWTKLDCVPQIITLIPKSIFCPRILFLFILYLKKFWLIFTSIFRNVSVLYFFQRPGIFGTLKFSNIVHATRAGKHSRETILTVFFEAAATEVKFCPAASNLTSFCP